MKDFCKLIKKPTIQKKNGWFVNKRVHRKEILKALKGIGIFFFVTLLKIEKFKLKPALRCNVNLLDWQKEKGITPLLCCKGTKEGGTVSMANGCAQEPAPVEGHLACTKIHVF